MDPEPARVAEADDWRCRWAAPQWPGPWMYPEPDEVYFGALYDEVARLRRNEGRFVGTSSVEREALQ